MSIYVQPDPVVAIVEDLKPDLQSNWFRQVLLSLWLGLFIAYPLSAENTTHSGNGLVDGGKIKPYSLNWNQCALKEGRWALGGTLHEKLDQIGDTMIRIRQTTMRPDGGTVIVSSFYTRPSFSVLRIEQEIHQADGTKVAWAEYDFDRHGYRGSKTRGEETRELSGSLTSNMLNGAALGLPLASLDWQEQPLSLLASMIGMDASYDVTATWVDKERIATQAGDPVESWLIDVEWKHRELGDVYPPGPDASGGRYWIVHQPPDGFPPVVRYKTDTYVVEYMQEYCPASK